MGSMFLGLAGGSIPTRPQGMVNPGSPEESPAFGGAGRCGKGLKYSFLDLLKRTKSKQRPGVGDRVTYFLFKGQLKNKKSGSKSYHFVSCLHFKT